MADSFVATVASGSLRTSSGVTMPHAWTAEGVTVDCEFTGAHVLHLSVAGCVVTRRLVPTTKLPRFSPSGSAR